MPPKRTINIESAKIGEGGKFEGKFVSTKNPSYIATRDAVFERLLAVQTAKAAGNKEKPIEIILPDGAKKEGVAWKTTPMDIAMGISKKLAGDVVVAQVTYLEAVSSVSQLQGDVMNASLSDDEDEEPQDANTALWDMTRPLEGSCKLELIKFDNPKGTEAFWHSSAHMLGLALEQLYGGHLCVGPPLESGFYYDTFVGDKKITEADFADIQAVVDAHLAKKLSFDRLVITKEEALELFAENPFKVQLISTKIPDGAMTSAYRCGTLIDLCRGPHVPNTGSIKTFACTKNSSAYWLGKAEYDSLQRIYGISFPDDKKMKDYKKMLAEAAERDHRNVGNKQELFFFHASVSPGSCFWQPMGARLYNTLVEFMRREYHIRNFQEVITPNIYSEHLFKTSGHYQNYKDNMYGFDVEGEDWFLKPMNCPGHCMVFDHRVRSYKELPMRMASFGVLHRNELSGTLSGLTRVRRFQQDDAHIFVRNDQIKSEVKDALDFLYYVYKVFGFEFTIALSTRPKKAIGEKSVWDKAELALKEALNESGVDWSLNPGDGAFYGPKIDIRLTDAMRRRHQCGTIQLDFQLPIRFNLQYKAEGCEDEAGAEDAETKDETKADKKDDKKKGAEDKKDAKKKDEKKEAEAPKPEETPKAGETAVADPKKKAEYVWKEQKVKPGFERPVIIHRAILGSVERMVAILTEHFGGKWPFWMSPRQVMVIPISNAFNDYAKYVTDTLNSFRFFAELDPSSNTLNKKIRNAQIAQWNYQCIVGEQEEGSMSVNLRSRDSKNPIGDLTLAALIDKLKAESNPSSKPFDEFTAFKGRMPEGIGAAAPAAAAGKAPAAKSAPAAKADKATAAPAKGAASPTAAPDKAPKGGNSNEAHLENHPYMGGFAPSKKDADLFATMSAVPSTPHLARWYEHISSFTAIEKNSWR